MLSTIYLAAEDEPGLAVGRKLVAEVPPLTVYREDNAHGFGRLRKKAPSFQNMGSHGLPVLMLTDLDACPCPSVMINEWLGRRPSSGFLFRICIREVEAWLLADRMAMANFLSVSLSKLPASPETLTDPKAKLISISQHSKVRKIRMGFKPAGTSAIGPDYNPLLSEFIRDCWNPDVAAANSSSLVRARTRLRALAETVRNLQSSSN